MHTVHIELNSIDFEPCSRMIDNCSTAFDLERRSARSRKGDGKSSYRSNIDSSFNPRPALSCGATQVVVCSLATGTVSIRAPHFHAGRQQVGK